MKIHGIPGSAMVLVGVHCIFEKVPVGIVSILEFSRSNLSGGTLQYRLGGTTKQRARARCKQ